MRHSRHFCEKCAVLAAHFLLLGVYTVTVHAAVPVEDRTVVRQPSQPEAQTGAQTYERPQTYQDPRYQTAQASDLPPLEETDDSRLNELFYQMQILQQEVQQMRGLLEEQEHRMSRMAREQQERYMDVDRRLSQLSGQAVASGDATAPTTGPNPVPGAAAGTEREAYNAAVNLMRNRDFEQSIAAFDKLIIDYPNGQYTPNAFYWLGELHLATENLEKSRQLFVQIITLYPKHNKVPDALYKLGVVYHRLGDVERSLEYLDRVIAEHPNATAAGLARSYAAELR